MTNILLVTLALLISAPRVSAPPKNIWGDRVLATHSFLQKHMWNPATGNYVRRADQPTASTSDAWGITIILDAYAYMVDGGFLKRDELKRYYTSSTALYERSGTDRGARILARQSGQIYVGGDDD